MRARASLRFALGVSVLLASAPVANRGAGLLAPRTPEAAPKRVDQRGGTGLVDGSAANPRAGSPAPSSASKARAGEADADVVPRVTRQRSAADEAPGLPPTALHPDRFIVSTSREAFVRAEPDPRSTKLGYLRAGARVVRSAEPAGHRGCAGGWYRVAPEGYVCAGETATIDLAHPLALAAERRPDRRSPLPYIYGAPRGAPPLLFDHVPTRRELASQGFSVSRAAAASVRGQWPLGDAPELLRDGRLLPTLFGHTRPSAAEPERALHKSGFAFLSLFESAAGAFGLTTQMKIVPLARVERVRASDFAGIILDDSVTLPVAFVKTRSAYLYDGDPTARGLVPARPLAYREAIPLTGRRVTGSGVAYLETREGRWIVDRQLVRVDEVRPPRGFERRGRTWLDVSILKQTLVAYDGARPVFATLVSTGTGGFGDPEQTHATVRGQFRIHTKHVTATMSSDEVGDEFDLSDVPYVQYFSEGYALHAAYWHDAFGTPKSHGCINLSPSDARFLFHFTDPPVPMAWHGAFSLRRGTLVSIHA